MTLTEAIRLAKRITRDDPQCHITGTRCRSLIPGMRIFAYDVEAIDTRTGYPFVVTGPDDWDERVKAANAPGLEEG